MHITIGADPEMFLYDTKKACYVSAAGFFPGTKKEPFKVDCGAIQVDGIALEFNITPSDNVKDFVANIKTVRNQMDKMVHEVNKDWQLRSIPYIHINKNVWGSVPDDAKELGCDPDFNYLGSINPNPTDRIEQVARQNNWGAVRTGSGHLHIGWSENEDPNDPLHFEDCRACSAFFSNNMVFYALRKLLSYSSLSLEDTRLQYYGGAGAFRPKSYGVELRTPSNTWVASDEDIKKAFSLTKSAFEQFASGAKSWDKNKAA